MGLMELPAEIFQEIINGVVDSIDLRDSMRLRLVSKSWAYQILHSVFSRPTVHTREIEVKAWSIGEHLLAQLVWEQLVLPGHREFQMLVDIEERAGNLAADATDPLRREEYMLKLCSLYAFELGGMQLVSRFDTRVGYPNDRRRQLLVAAAFVGDVGLVQRLLEKHGADFYARYLEQSLRAAAHAGHIEVVRLLLKRDADPTDKAAYGGNALTAAASGGHLSIIELLLPEGATHSSADDYNAAIDLAAQNGYSDVVIKLIEARGYSTAESRDSCWMTALTQAASRGQLTTVEAIIERGSFEHAKAPQGAPLFEACLRGWPKVVRVLLERGHPKTKTEADQLHQAARQGHTEIVQMLIDYGMDMSAVPTPLTRRFPQPKSTPLFAAASTGHISTVKLLLRNGVDLSIDKCGVRAISEAERQGFGEIAVLLRERSMKLTPTTTPTLTPTSMPGMPSKPRFLDRISSVWSRMKNTYATRGPI